ncbi:putative aldo/keto reductase [Lophiostoma macrostomum CBS 122681]|uniref:Putative aldo/keto reductase n=1 Tax=Lophiostoma macrostomum CBS 122681 TaxID=1314788 RepID=A0A6A6STB4_9PLEO|nr:putative aldo/keto reductase [Lophiostoma macrostomum CBS 122681]
MAIPAYPLHQLGKNGLSVPSIGFGLMGTTGVYGSASDDEETMQLLDAAVEIGATFWDTANMYGDNEEKVGKWFKRSGKRDSIFLATKFGIMMEGMKFVGVDSSAEYCRQQCEKSLQKLGVQSIDLYYVHRVNPKTPIEETMRAMAELKAEGKIKHIGLCEVSSATLRRACKIAPVTAVQMEYHPFVREIETAAGTNLLQTCRELGVAVVCFSPLGRGLLTGSFTGREDAATTGDIRSSWVPWFSEENLDSNVRIVNRFKQFAEKKGCTATQLTLAWILKQGNDVFPIPGTTKVKYLKENMEAARITLTDGDEAEIRNFLEENPLAGYRQMEAAKMFAFVDTAEEA